MRLSPPVVIVLVGLGCGRPPGAHGPLPRLDDPPAARAAPSTADVLAGCSHEALGEGVHSILCAELQIEGRALQPGDAAAHFDEMARRASDGGAVEEVADFVAAGRHYPARRVHVAGALPHALLVHTQLGADDGWMYVCSAKRPPAESDGCRRSIAQLIERGLPAESPVEARVLGLEVPVPDDCELARNTVVCGDGSQLQWKTGLDRAQLAAEMPVGDSSACLALGVAAECRRGQLELAGPDGAPLAVEFVAALLEQSGRVAGVLCSWPAGTEPPALCAGFAAP